MALLEFQRNSLMADPQREPASEIPKLVWRHKFLSVLSLCAGLAAAFVVSAVVKPTYDASATIIVGPGASDRMQDPLQQARANESLARLAESEEVVRDAVEKVGLDALAIPPERHTSAYLDNIGIVRAVVDWAKDFALSHPWLNVIPESSPRTATPLERALPVVSKALFVRADRNSDLIRISFRHKDPAVAAEFSNAIANSLIERKLRLFNMEQTAKFYDEQAEVFNAQIRRASETFRAFSVANGVYAIAQQKELLIRRESELAASLFTTRASIADKRGQAEKLASELHVLKPVAASSFVSTVVDSLRPRPSLEANEEGGARQLTIQASEPPLLMVKVYQDSMALLFKLGAELSGLTALEAETASQLDKLHAELAQLASKEAEYDRLERAVTEATLNADAYANRAVDEEVKTRLTEAKISGLKIFEYASAPLHSNRPFYFVPLIAGVIGLVLSIVAALGAERLREMAALRKRSRSRRVQPETQTAAARTAEAEA
jgi:uncharacterized protein involved in exopolysaccharide biosynthesis